MAREAVSLNGCNKRGRDLLFGKSLPFFVGTLQRRAAARFEKPRIVSKGFNWFVQSFRLYALIRGLQNLGTPCEGERIVTFCGVQKVTKKHAGLRPATSIQSSIEKNFSKIFRRHEPNPVFRTKRRRKGFESVRKGYRSADARLMFFEKGLLYCKLTVGFCR